MSSFEDSKYYKEIAERLSGVENKEFTSDILTTLQFFFITVTGLFLVFSLAEYLFRFSSVVRTILFFTWAGVSAGVFIYYIALPLYKKILEKRKDGIFDAARKVGSRFPDVKDELLNAMQLASIKNKHYSGSLIDAAFKKIYNKTSRIEFRRAVDYSRPKKVLTYSSVLLFITLTSFGFSEGMRNAADRLTNYGTEYIPPARFKIEVIPGNTSITKGEDVNITIKVSGDPAEEVTLYYKDETGAEYEEQRLVKDSTGSFSYPFYSVRNSVEYYAAVEEVSSEEYIIEVVDRPVIKTFSVNLNPPNYTGLKSSHQKDNGSLAGIYGTYVSFSLLATKELEEAYLLYDDSSAIDLTTEESRASGSFRLTRNGEYRIILKDKGERTNDEPIVYPVNVSLDDYPAIEIIEPAENVNLSEEQRLPLLAKASDDYGISKVLINYRLSASKYEPPQENFSTVEIPLDNVKRELDIDYIWNLTGLSLAMEDELTYYIEVFDNDIVSGPKSVKSKMYKVRIPSFEELFSQADEEQEDVEKELATTLEEAKKLQQEMEKISQDLRKDKAQLDWEEQENIKKSMEKFEELQDKVNEINDKLSDTRKELQKNDLLSPETMEKYLELQELMNELSSDEMRKLFEQMQKNMSQINRKNIQQQFSDLKKNEEAFQKSIERTLNLLKRIRVEQKLDEAMKRSESLQQKQEQLEKATDEADPENSNEMKNLEKRQKEAGDEIERLDQEMKDLQKMMDEIEDMPSEELEKMREEFEKQQNQKLSEDAAQQLQKQNTQNAMQKQQQISQNMQKTMENLNQLQQSVQQQNQMQTFSDMMKALDNVLKLSKEQESLKERMKGIRQNSLDNEGMKKQSKMRSDLDKITKQLSELAQKTFAITPEMGRALGNARSEMDNALNLMQNRNNNAAINNMGSAMQSLNEAAVHIQNNLNNMMQGGSGQGGGMMSLMQQMQKLSGMQMSLNNMTQQMQQYMQGNMTPEQQAQFERLAAEQELIRKSLDQLNREAKSSGKSKSIPANLDKILEEMKEVVTDMQTEKLDDELIQKQEHILSRLLDAQRSINERDYEKERESITGKTFDRTSPGKLNLSKEQFDLLRDELNKAVREGYSRDYQELIRKYYEALEKMRDEE